MEIQELKRDLEIFFTDSENGYGLYSTERLLILAQQGDEKAKLQILFNFKGLIYKTWSITVIICSLAPVIFCRI